MAFEVREVQPTPNPNAAKFILDKEISERPMSFFDVGASRNHPLAAQLFEIPGVSSVLMLGDFVTINKSPEAHWTDIQIKVKHVLATATHQS